MSERRSERLVNSSLSGLPPFLVDEGGLNSGMMMVHCTAAALVSENKGLCHPSSIDSISTSAAKEDHVSMGGWSARKALQVVENVERVLAIELVKKEGEEREKRGRKERGRKERGRREGEEGEEREERRERRERREGEERFRSFFFF